MRVLLAEDYRDTRELIVLALEQVGWEVFAAKDGRDALRIYHTEIEDRIVNDELVKGVAFDVLVLDVVMPRLNGFGVGYLVRRFEGFAGAPRAVIVYLTGKDDVVAPEDLLDAEVAGAHFADVYLRKPITTVELIEKIEEVVKKGEEPTP